MSTFHDVNDAVRTLRRNEAREQRHQAAKNRDRAALATRRKRQI